MSHTCQRYGDGTVFFRGDCPACAHGEALRQAYEFLNDALEESDLTEDEMHAAPGTFWVRLLCARQRLDDARASSAPFAEARNPSLKPESGAG